MNASDQIIVFDRALVRRHRDRAAREFAAHRALFEETAGQLMERLGDVKREFTSILDLGDRDGFLARALQERYKSFVVTTDFSEMMLQQGRSVPLPSREGIGEGECSEKPPHQQKLRLAKEG